MQEGKPLKRYNGWSPNKLKNSTTKSDVRWY